jgi:hypothetical protein
MRLVDGDASAEVISTVAGMVAEGEKLAFTSSNRGKNSMIKDGIKP